MTLLLDSNRAYMSAASRQVWFPYCPRLSAPRGGMKKVLRFDLTTGGADLLC